MKKAELLEEIRLIKASLVRAHVRSTGLERRQALQEEKIKELTQALANLSHNTYPHKL